MISFSKFLILHEFLRRDQEQRNCLLIAPSFLAPGVARYQLRSFLAVTS